MPKKKSAESTPFENITMNFELQLNSGFVNSPKELIFHDSKSSSLKVFPSNTYPFLNDVLFGLQYHSLNDFSFLNLQQKDFAKKVVLEIDPYHQIYFNSSNSLRTQLKNFNKKTPEKSLPLEVFEKKVSDFFFTQFNSKKLTFSKWSELIEDINAFETQLGSPLIYNISMHLNPAIVDKLLGFYSFLFHMRTLVANDYNHFVEDSVFQSLKCDSITDYIPKSDFTVNDAILYWQFKKLSTPFYSKSPNEKNADLKIENLLLKPLERAFEQYSHNACALIHQLPESFLANQSLQQLEDSLHHLQMNWLLGTPSGLLFRIREELFALQNGYSEIFWPETLSTAKKPTQKLFFQFEFSEKDLNQANQKAS